MKRFSLVAVALFLAGCMTLPAARPLQPGHHAVGLTIGGPIADIGPTIPLPNAIIEGRSGVARLAHRPFDVNYGLNLTPIAYGVVQGHIGASWLLLQELGWWPSLSVANRVFFGFNPFGRESDAPESFGVWGMDQLELVAAHNIGDHFMWWASLSEYLDFRDPSLILTPGVGLWFNPGGGPGFAAGVETKWYGFHRRLPVDTVNWWPGGHGALGVALMVGYVF